MYALERQGHLVCALGLRANSDKQILLKSHLHSGRGLDACQLSHAPCCAQKATGSGTHHEANQTSPNDGLLPRDTPQAAKRRETLPDRRTVSENNEVEVAGTSLQAVFPIVA